MVSVEDVAGYLDDKYTPTNSQKRILKENAQILQKRYAGTHYSVASDKVNENLASTFSIIPTGADQTRLHPIFTDWGSAALALSHAQDRIIQEANNPSSPVVIHYAKMKGVPKNAKDYVAKSVEDYWQGSDMPTTPALTQLIDLIFKNTNKDSLKRLHDAWTPDEFSQKRIDDSMAYLKEDHERGLAREWFTGDFDEANARFETYGSQQWPNIRNKLKVIISQGIQNILDADTTYAPNAPAKHLLVEAMLEGGSHGNIQNAPLLTAIYINQTYFDTQHYLKVESVASYQPESRGHHTISQPPTMVRYYDVKNPIINNEYLSRMVVPVNNWWGKGINSCTIFSQLAQRILKEHTQGIVEGAKAQIEHQTAQDKRQYDQAKEYVMGEQGYLTVVGKLMNEMMQSDDSKLPKTFIPYGQVTIKTSEWLEWTGGMDKLVSAIHSLLNRNVANHKNRLADAKKQYERTLKQRRDTLNKLEE